MPETKFTPGPWSGLNMVHEDGRPMTPSEIGEYVKNSVLANPDNHNFWSLSPQHTGQQHIGIV